MTSGEGTSRALVAGSAILGVGLSVAIVFTLLLVMRPADGPIAITQALPEAEECPVGTGAPACFRFAVTNASTWEGAATCVLTPGVGTQAAFTDGTLAASLTLAPGETSELVAKVSVVEGDEAVTPMMSCSAV